MSERCVVVIGLGTSGLFLVRQLSKITSNIYAIGRSDDIGMFSKYLEKGKRYYAATADEIEAIFLDIKHKEGRKPLLYICSDQYISILLEQKNRWNDLVDCSYVNFDILEIINDKNILNLYCQNQGIKIPESISYEEFKKNLFFPVIIKWVEKRIETSVNPIGKVRVCCTSEEFEYVDNVVQAGIICSEDLFVQKYVEGNNGFQFSVGGYYRNGLVLADVVVRQVKQYPQGISAEVITSEGVIGEKLKKISRLFAKQINYSGFLEMEYKIDEKSKEIYLLDVNPRPWGWVSILGVVYSDFYKVLDGKIPESKRCNVIWESKMRILMGRRNGQNIDETINRFEAKMAYDIKDKEDIMPSIMIYLMVIKKIIRRIRARRFFELFKK